MSDADVRDAYNARAGQYADLFGDVGQNAKLDRDLIARWRDSTSGLLLDAGCGPGHWTQFLHHGPRDVLGIDLSEQFLVSARSRYPALSFVRGTFLNIPLPPASLGGILAWYSIIHTSPDAIPSVLEAFARVLEPDGSLLLGFFDGEAAEPFAHAVAPAYFWSLEFLEAGLVSVGFTVTEHHQRRDESRRPHGAIVARLGT